MSTSNLLSNAAGIIDNLSTELRVRNAEMRVFNIMADLRESGKGGGSMAMEESFSSVLRSAAEAEAAKERLQALASKPLPRWAAKDMTSPDVYAFKIGKILGNVLYSISGEYNVEVNLDDAPWHQGGTGYFVQDAEATTGKTTYLDAPSFESQYSPMSSTAKP